MAHQEGLCQFQAETIGALNSVYRFALKLTGDASDPEDLVQVDSFINWEQTAGRGSLPSAGTTGCSSVAGKIGSLHMRMLSWKAWLRGWLVRERWKGSVRSSIIGSLPRCSIARWMYCRRHTGPPPVVIVAIEDQCMLSQLRLWVSQSAGFVRGSRRTAGTAGPLDGVRSGRRIGDEEVAVRKHAISEAGWLAHE